MPDPIDNSNGPWWSKLSIAALAIVSFVYLGDRVGGRYVSLLEEDMVQQRGISANIAEALDDASLQAERRNEIFSTYSVHQAEANRIQRRILEVLQKQCS